MKHSLRKTLNSLLVTLLALTFAQNSFAVSTKELDAKVKAALETFYANSPNSKDFVQNAKGILIFPEISKAGFFVGGEYGLGALVVNGRVDSYYNVTGASLGFTFGVQVHSQMALFLTEEALENFKNSAGWDFGVEGSVAVANAGIGGQIDNHTITKPVVVYVFDNKGLMANVNLATSKVTKLEPEPVSLPQTQASN